MTEFVINCCTITPVREKPAEGSEQLTQLLFGEVCEILDRLPRWTKIRSTVDGQEGWVDFKMMKSVEITEKEELSSYVVAVPTAIATDQEKYEEYILTMGTRLSKYANGFFEVAGVRYRISPDKVNRVLFSNPLLSPCMQKLPPLEELPSDVKSQLVRMAAVSLLNTPYLWGGKSALGMDCSGFTQVVYSLLGVNLLRNAREQITQGTLVASLADVQSGDLAFFDHVDRDPKATNISHVGLLLDNKKIIHCSGCVHVDDIDEMGIHSPDGELTHHLVQIRRYV